MNKTKPATAARKPTAEGVILLPAPVKAGLTPVVVTLPLPGSELDGLALAGPEVEEGATGTRPPVE